MHDRTKEIIDALTWRPFNTPRLIRADTTVAHKILNLHAADTADINRTRRAAFKTAHPDSLTGSPGFTSDQGALGRCLEEAKHLRGVHRDGDLGDHAHGGGRMGTAQESGVLPAAGEEPPSGSREFPNGRERQQVYRQLQDRKGRPPKRLPPVVDPHSNRRGHAQIKKRHGQEHRTRPRARGGSKMLDETARSGTGRSSRGRRHQAWPRAIHSLAGTPSTTSRSLNA